PLGAPLIGWLVDRFGARVALAAGALSGLLAGGVALGYLVRHRDPRLQRDAGRWRLPLRPAPAQPGAVRAAAGERGAASEPTAARAEAGRGLHPCAAQADADRHRAGCVRRRCARRRGRDGPAGALPARPVGAGRNAADPRAGWSVAAVAADPALAADLGTPR